MRLVWHYLQQGQRKTSTRSPEQLQALRAETIAQIDRVEAEEEFSARRGKLCDWCEYKEFCPEFGGSLRASAGSEGRKSPAPPTTTPEATPSEDQLDLV
jgi:RecB family exonuclease